jgi:CheY-like chemotaxis protein
MRVLLVEDSADFAGSVEQAVRPIPQCELVWAPSRDSAIARLSSGSFDLVLLDRRIPSADGILDDHANHGWHVFLYVREEYPGTPVWFLTGTEDADFAAEINNEYGRYEDLHGQPEQLYRVFWKKHLNECIRKVKEFAQKCSVVDRIALRLPPDTARLNPEESRTIRLFGQRYNGTAVDVTPLNGGFSESRVLNVVVRAADNSLLISAAAKISLYGKIQEEADRYRADICRLIQAVSHNWLRKSMQVPATPRDSFMEW